VTVTDTEDARTI